MDEKILGAIEALDTKITNLGSEVGGIRSEITSLKEDIAEVKVDLVVVKQATAMNAGGIIEIKEEITQINDHMDALARGAQEEFRELRRERGKEAA